MRLVIDGVGKQYGSDSWGLRDFSLELNPGVLGLLGPNGAGKSTLMRILATVAKPTEGRVTWDGVDIVESPDALRSTLGYLPQDFGVYPNLNAVEFLDYLAAMKGLGAEVIFHGLQYTVRMSFRICKLNLLSFLQLIIFGIAF